MKSISKIIQSKNDPRIYRYISLPNQLSCLLISDKETDKSAASISVGVGSLEDPKNTPGLAHFLEHMLFLGTEKYPNQSEYKAYLIKNSGALNAYTSSTETVYYFSCSNQAFSGALDRFSNFFIKPLFNEDCTEREMQAVHSEHQKNLMNDSWRLMQLVRSSALKHTAYNHFSTGDITTLRKPEIREQLIQFYKRYYSSNIMKLVLYGNESIEEIEKKAIDFFSPIIDQKIGSIEYKEMPFISENLAKIYFVKSIRNSEKLKVVWYVENLRPYFKSNPASYITFLIGHEGKNSLLSYLIDEDLALELSAGFSTEMNLFSTIEVSIKLTKKGLDNYLEVCEILFKYLQMLKEKGVQKYIFEEKKYINELKFDFKEKEKPDGYVIPLSSNMQIFPIENILNHNFLLEEFQPEIIKKFLDQMLLENMRIYVISESFENLDSTEPIYGTQYTEKNFGPEIINIFNNPALNPKKTKKKLDLPIANLFLPKNLSQKEEISTEFPEKILTTNQSEVFFKKDNKFLTPKSNIHLRVFCKNETFPFDIKSYLSSKIWNQMVYNELRETIYLAQMANLNASLYTHAFGIDFSFKGFSDGLLKLIEEIISKVSSLQIEFDLEKFKVIHHDFLQEYSDFQKGQPLGIASHLLKVITETGPIFFFQDLYENIKTLTFEEFLSFSRDFFKNLRFEWFGIGNLTSEDLKSLALSIEKFFNKNNLTSDLIPKLRVVEFEKGNTVPCYEFHLQEPKQNNSSFLLTFQDKRKVEPTNFLHFWLFSDILKEPFFSKLRTDEQLGYIVYVRPSEDRGVCSLQFAVQSERKDPQYLATRVWNFIEEFEKKLMALNILEFEKFKASILVKIREKDLNIFQEGSRYWDEIVKHRYDFNRKENNARFLKDIKLEEFIEFAKDLIYSNPKVLEILVVSQHHKAENEKNRNERKEKGVLLEVFENVGDFKKNKSCYEDYYHP